MLACPMRAIRACDGASRTHSAMLAPPQSPPRLARPRPPHSAVHSESPRRCDLLRCGAFNAAVNAWRVERGDTLESVARYAGLPLRALQAANPGVDGQCLYPGLVLALPVRRGAEDEAPTLLQMLAPAPHSPAMTLHAAILSPPPSVSTSAGAEPLTAATLGLLVLQLAGLTLYGLMLGVRQPSPQVGGGSQLHRPLRERLQAWSTETVTLSAALLARGRAALQAARMRPSRRRTSGAGDASSADE